MAEPAEDIAPVVESIVRSESPLGTILSTDAEDDGATMPGGGPDLIGLTSTFGSFDTTTATALHPDDPLLSSTAPTMILRSDSPVAAKAVTTERKHELLLMARADRVRWIYQVPLPYQTGSAHLSPLETFLEQSHASRYLPSAKVILEHLYGQNHGDIDKKQQQPRPQPNARLMAETQADDLYPSGPQMLKRELSVAREPVLSILKRYDMFLKYLEETAVLVQGMRSFCRNFNKTHCVVVVSNEAAAAAATTTAMSNNNRDVAIVQMQTYLQATAKSVKDKASLESFIFGHCRSTVERLVPVPAGQAEAFTTKMAALQFITATHLDIAIDESLLPVATLQSVDSFHSTYEKLQRILHVYHGVHDALKAVNETKLPSADDVLPAIILTVLRAQPVNLLWNLKFIEEWSPAEYLRGEAGYSFTNLFGAVQFLEDLTDPTSLSISADEFHTKMAAWRQSMDERHKNHVQQDHVPKMDALLDGSSSHEVQEIRVPTANEIRQARNNGEIINLEWALAWQKGLPPVQESTTEGPAVTERRQYSFLASRPEDIRLKDLPDLLGEYRDLFEAMERLRAEKAAESARARRKKNDVTERDLIDVARSLNLL